MKVSKSRRRVWTRADVSPTWTGIPIQGPASGPLWPPPLRRPGHPPRGVGRPKLFSLHTEGPGVVGAAGPDRAQDLYD